jgi:hypothetical protein
MTRRAISGLIWRRCAALGSAVVITAACLLACVTAPALGAAVSYAAPCVVNCTTIDMAYDGGPVVSAPRIDVIYYNGEATTDPDSISSMVSAVGGSSWWSRLSEYDTNVSGGTDQTIATPTASLIALTASAPSTLTDSNIQATLEANITGSTPTWGAPQLDSHGYDDTIYVFVFPFTTVVTDNGEYSDENFCAYHNSVTVTVSSKSVSVPYIVLPTAGSDEASICGDSSVSSETETETIDELAAQQIADTVADPDPVGDTGWYDTSHGLEIGSACDTKDGDAALVSGYVLPDLWSNADDDCSLSVPGTFTQLALGDSSSSIEAGSYDVFGTTGTDSAGDQFSNETIATTFTISPNGAGTGASCTAATCAATKAGTYTVTGTDGTKSGQIEITITPGSPSSLVVSPASATVLAGTSSTFSAEGLDTYGNPTGALTASTVFSMSPSGGTTGASCNGDQCTATQAGTYTVTGAYGLAHGSTTLVVESATGTVSGGTATVSGTGANVSVGCAGASGASCQLQLQLTVNETTNNGKLTGVAARKKVTTVVVGTETVTIGAGQSKKVKVSLNATGKRLLKKEKDHLSAKLSITERVSGKSVSVKTRTLKFH